LEKVFSILKIKKFPFLGSIWKIEKKPKNQICEHNGLKIKKK